MICLGIEGTAHTIGVGIVDENCNVLANKNMTYSPKQGGIHPREAANHHAEHLPGLISEALAIANISKSEIECVSFSQGPGLGPCLRTAATGARALSLSVGKPLIGVNHCVAHLEVGKAKTGCNDPVMLYASGANTQVIAFANGRYRVFGETLDIGIGNMLDKFGREAGMKFPSGPKIEELAKNGEFTVDLPYSVKGMDVAFSGILTAAKSHLDKGASINDVCYSLQETCFAMLVEVTERAMAHSDKTELLMAGGVVRNERLRQMCKIMAEDRGASMHVPEGSLCVDNGAMIAWLGLIMNNAGLQTSVDDSIVDQKQRTDMIDVTW